MQPAISTGTVLQNRYRLLKVLGQGGFGRTYLAEDQGRFNEPCALKEFIPIQAGAYALEKSKELFQREASILYQIQHPQIPQFRATFEENERLFLVQDFVEGKTYRDLLNERKMQGKTFSEAEVMQLMRQLLPVLAHIHSKGIIHRDIAPDNIILRQQDNLPVLIDFGVVKEVVTRFNIPGMTEQNTTVGKLGYAPSEQMQTGRAYPSSDLYSLAVTVIVLLTGREPQELYDDVNLTWYWQKYVNVRPGFAQILNRMLTYRPGDRYQSVSEVAQALQTLINPAASPGFPTIAPTPNSPGMPTAPAAPPASNVSQMQTLAVGRRPEPLPASSRQARTPDPIVPRPTGGSVWDNPLAVIGICLGLAVVTGIGSWAVVSAILNTSEPSPSTASPTITATASPSSSPSPSPSPSTAPIEYTQRLNLPAGETTTAEGNLKANETVTYIVTVATGETLNASLADEGVLLTILGPDQEPISDAERVRSWTGTLETPGDYYIQISPVRNISESDYKVTIGLEPAAEPSPPPPVTPPPTSTPSTPASPEIDTQRVRFPQGADSILVAERVAPNLIRRYLVRAEAGQVLTLEVVGGNISFNVRFPNGDPVEDASGSSFWEAQLPESGDYQIDVSSNDAVDFTLRISVTGEAF
jgi:serine/threonine-protein kinase